MDTFNVLGLLILTFILTALCRKTLNSQRRRPSLRIEGSSSDVPKDNVIKAERASNPPQPVASHSRASTASFVCNEGIDENSRDRSKEATSVATPEVGDRLVTYPPANSVEATPWNRLTSLGKLRAALYMETNMIELERPYNQAMFSKRHYNDVQDILNPSGAFVSEKSGGRVTTDRKVGDCFAASARRWPRGDADGRLGAKRQRDARPISQLLVTEANTERGREFYLNSGFGEEAQKSREAGERVPITVLHCADSARYQADMVGRATSIVVSPLGSSSRANPIPQYGGAAEVTFRENRAFRWRKKALLFRNYIQETTPRDERGIFTGEVLSHHFHYRDLRGSEIIYGKRV